MSFVGNGLKLVQTIFWMLWVWTGCLDLLRAEKFRLIVKKQQRKSWRATKILFTVLLKSAMMQNTKYVSVTTAPLKMIHLKKSKKKKITIIIKFLALICFPLKFFNIEFK